MSIIDDHDGPTKDWSLYNMVLCSLYFNKSPQTAADVLDFIIIHLYGDLIELGYDPDETKWKKSVRSLLSRKVHVNKVDGEDINSSYWTLIGNKVQEVENILVEQTVNHKLRKMIPQRDESSTNEATSGTNLEPLPVAAVAVKRKRGRPFKIQSTADAAQTTYSPLAKRLKLSTEDSSPQNSGKSPVASKSTPSSITLENIIFTPSDGNIRLTRARSVAPPEIVRSVEMKKTDSVKGLKKSQQDTATPEKTTTPSSASATPIKSTTLSAPTSTDIKRKRGRPRKQ